MLRSAAMSIIKSRLGNIQGTAHDALIIANMQLAQATVLERGEELPWFLYTDSSIEGTNLTTVANQDYVALPDTFLRLDDEKRYPVLRVDSIEPSGYFPLEQMDYSDMIGKYVTGDAALQAGRPIKFDLIGNRMFLRYIPNGIYTLRFFYIKSDLVLDSDIENQWLKYAPDWVIAETCRQSAEDLQYQKLVDKFVMDADKAKARVFKETISRREAGAMRAMGDK